MAERTVAPHLDHLPLFPLPGVVLFPSMRMPLHIFEPRYRQMVRDATQGDLPIAMGNAIPVGDDDVGLAPIHPIVGVGFIDKLEELPDGRFLIELVGQSRVRVLREVESDAPYRIVSGEPLVEAIRSPQPASKVVDEFRHLVLAIHQSLPRAATALSAATGKRHAPGEIADAVAGVVQADPAARQAWLEETDPIIRLDSIMRALEGFLLLADKDQATVH